MLSPINRTSVTILCALLATGLGRCDEVNVESEPSTNVIDYAEETAYLLRGMQHGRELLRRGVVKVQGIREIDHPEKPNRNLKEKVTGFIAFDFDTNRLRHDFSFPVRTGGSFRAEDFQDGKTVQDLTEAMSHYTAFRTINSSRTPEYFVWYELFAEGGSNLMIADADQNWSPGLTEDFHVMDLRSLGLIDYHEFHGENPRFCNPVAAHPNMVHQHLPIEGVIERMMECKVSEITKNDSMVTLQWCGYTLTIDEENGFTPVSYFNRVDHYREKQQNTTDWRSINDVWVPVGLHIEHVDVVSSGAVDRWDLELDWQSVNEDLDDSLFRYESFPDVHESAYVIDTRGGDSKILGKWADGKVINDFDVQPPRDNFQVSWIGGTLLFFFVALCVWLSRTIFFSPATTGDP